MFRVADDTGDVPVLCEEFWLKEERNFTMASQDQNAGGSCHFLVVLGVETRGQIPVNRRMMLAWRD